MILSWNFKDMILARDVCGLSPMIYMFCTVYEIVAYYGKEK